MFEHIKNLISLGHRVAVKTKIQGEWKVFLFINGDGNMEGTTSMSTIDESLETGLNDKHYDSKKFEENFTNEYKIVTPAPKLLPVGTKVVVLENCPYTVYRGKEMIIEYVDEFSFEYRLSDCFHHIPHWAVAPIEETEPHKYQEVIDLIEGVTDNFITDEMRLSAAIVKEILLERIKNLK